MKKEVVLLWHMGPLLQKYLSVSGEDHRLHCEVPGTNLLAAAVVPYPQARHFTIA